MVMDELPAQELVKANPELKILDEELFTDVYSMAVQKGNTELLDKINEVLQKLMDEGKIEEIYHESYCRVWRSGGIKERTGCHFGLAFSNRTVVCLRLELDCGFGV